MVDSPYIFEVGADDFQRVVVEGSRQQPVLVDFWADWCAPCKSLMPLLARLAEEYQGKFILAKVNTEEQRELAAQYGIRSLPTVKLFLDGQAKDEFMGALPEPQVRAFLDRNIPRESDTLLERADSLLLQGQAKQAGELIEQANRMDPDSPRVRISYARYKATLGELEDAERLLRELPPEERDKPEVVALLARIQFDRVADSAPPVERLEQILQGSPTDPQALYQLAAHRVMANDYEAALELLLRSMQADRHYLDDAARKAIVEVFALLGNEGELVKRYRSRLFNLLH